MNSVSGFTPRLGVNPSPVQGTPSSMPPNAFPSNTPPPTALPMTPPVAPQASPNFQVNPQLQAQALSTFNVGGQNISLPPGATATVQTGSSLVTLKAPAGFVPAGGMQTPITPTPPNTQAVGSSVAPPQILGTDIASGVQAGLQQGQLIQQQQTNQQLQQLWQQLTTQAQTNQALAQQLQGLNQGQTGMPTGMTMSDMMKLFSSFQ